MAQFASRIPREYRTGQNPTGSVRPREHDLQPKRRRRFMATTDSDHDNPIFPDLARDRVVGGPNQLWVADIT